MKIQICAITKIDGVIMSAKTYPEETKRLTITGKKSEMFYFDTITKKWNCSQDVVDAIEAFNNMECIEIK